MIFLDFQKTFLNFPVISIMEIEKHFPHFDSNTLTRWQKAGYLQKVRNGHYRLTNRAVTNGEEEIYFLANRIYQPSYVSLHSALSWYGFIPEGVFSVTSVSTLKTYTLPSVAGHFSYHHVKASLYFGYRLEPFGHYRFKIAEPEKAVLDFFYIHSIYDSEAAIEALRLNYWQMNERLNMEKLAWYTDIYKNAALARRIRRLFKLIG